MWKRKEKFAKETVEEAGEKEKEAERRTKGWWKSDVGSCMVHRTSSRERRHSHRRERGEKDRAVKLVCRSVTA